LKTVAKDPKNTLAIYRELRDNVGFKNHHGFYRQLRFCTQLGLVELGGVSKKWGIPTKTYRLTEKGKNFLQLLGNESQKEPKNFAPASKKIEITQLIEYCFSLNNIRRTKFIH